MTSNKLDVSKLSDDDIQDMFAEVYEEKIASINNIGSYECTCKRGGNNQGLKMEVMIVGMAGTPTLSDYKSMKIKNASALVIDREGRGSLKFKLVAEEMIALNTNDYVAVYKAV